MPRSPEDATTLPQPVAAPTRRLPPEFGERILHYVIGSPIGRGGMGHVVQARDEKLGRVVALKFMAPEMAGNAEAIERFTREAKATAAIAHPNVVAVHAIEYDGNVPFIAYEYIEGTTLAAEGKSLSLISRFSALRQIAAGLAATHAKHIVHRDVKLGNVVRQRDNRVVLVDFGVAKFLAIGPDATTLEPLTLEHQPVGTRRYMSPEQIEGSDITYASDVFSFGVLAYELLTGERPFDCEPGDAMLDAIAGGSFVAICSPNPGIDIDTARLLERCLSHTPGSRPTASDIAERLGALAGTVNWTTSNEPASIAPPEQKPSQEWHLDHFRTASALAADVGIVTIECRFTNLSVSPPQYRTVAQIYDTLRRFQILTDVSSVGRVSQDTRHKPVPGADGISAVIRFEIAKRLWYWAARTTADFYSLAVVPVDPNRIAIERLLGELFMNLVVVSHFVAAIHDSAGRIEVDVCVRGIRGMTLYATRRLELSDRTAAVDEASARVIVMTEDVRRSFATVAAKIFDGIAGYFDFAVIPASYYDYAVGEFRDSHTEVDGWLD